MLFVFRLFFLVLAMLSWLGWPDVVVADQEVSANSNPNWASLVYSRTRGRAGPSMEFQIKWIYHRRHLPVKVLRRASEWTQIEDMDGDILWMHNSVLDKRRTALVISSDPAFLYREFDETDRIIARIAPNVIVRVLRCFPKACEVVVKEKQGWVKVEDLWGPVQE